MVVWVVNTKMRHLDLNIMFTPTDGSGRKLTCKICGEIDISVECTVFGEDDMHITLFIVQ